MNWRFAGAVKGTRRSGAAWAYLSILILLLFGVLGTGSAGAGELAVDIVVYQDPPLTIPPLQQVFSKHLLPLWLEALKRPDAETRRLTAGTIAIAHERGMTQLGSAIAPLRETLRNDSDPVVRRAAANSLVAILAREAAADLAGAAEQDGVLMAQIVEPALAEWDYEPIRARWLARLDDPNVGRSLRLLAIGGLGRVREKQAIERLTEIIRPRSNEPTVRLAAARALGNIRDEGLTEFASELSAAGQSPAMFERLLAAQLLVRQSGAATVELLQTLAIDSDPSVATPALVHLFAIDTSAAFPLAVRALASPDAGLRSAAAPMIASQENADAIRTLRPILNDRNPTLRRSIAAKFAEFGGRDDLKPVVLEESMAILGSDAWRGLEQAALVLGTLDHKPAAPRLVELLDNPRGEVAITSAWALRKLRIPETLSAALTHAKKIHATKSALPHYGLEQSQLFQLFGEMRYREAEQLLRLYVPKGPMDPSPRMSACWALGYLFENQPENDLAGPFAERLADVSSPMPEVFVVRLATAIGLGRMKAKSQLAVLKQFAETDSQVVLTGAACYWSIEQITGEKPPPPPNRVIGAANWFLESTKE